MIPFCRDQGVGLIPWSPLARGFLAGNRQRGAAAPTKRAETDTYAHDMYDQDADYDVVDQVVALAKQHGVKPAQIALAWLLHKPGITAPIIGASKQHHLAELAAAVDITLSDEEIARLEAPYRPHRVLGHG